MYCTNCGKELPENSKFCNYCGALQQNEAVNVPTSHVEVQADKPILTNRQMRKVVQAKNKSKGCSTLAGIIGAIVCLMFFVYIFGDSDNSDSKVDSSVSSSTTGTVETTESPIEISASKLVQAYIDNEVKADMTYDDKTVIVSGRVNRIEQTDYLFMENELVIYVGTGDDIENCLRCYISTDQKEIVAELEQGDKITVTGRCAGLGSSYFNLKCVNIYDGVISE